MQRPPDQPPSHADKRRRILIEDAINIAAIFGLLLVVLLRAQQRVPESVYWSALAVLGAIVAVLFVRRAARVRELFARLKAEQQREAERMAGLPGGKRERLRGAERSSSQANRTRR